MAPNDQESAGQQAINQPAKSGVSKLSVVVSEQAVPQENEMKVPVRGILQKIVDFPPDTLFQKGCDPIIPCPLNGLKYVERIFSGTSRRLLRGYIPERALSR